MPKKRILLISASAGNGHVRAAQAIETYAKLDFSESIEIKHVDLYTLTTPLVRWVCQEGYILLINHFKFIWKILYKLTDSNKSSPFSCLQKAGERFFFRKILKVIKDFQPDDIICTHFTPPTILLKAKEKQQFKAKVWIQITDYHLHLQWFHKNVDGYFVGCETVKNDLIAHGIPQEKIIVNGIPIMPAFAQTYSREVCAKELHLNPNKKTYLLMNGGSASSQATCLAEKLLKLPDFQLIVIAGRNQNVYDGLCQLQNKYPDRLFPIGFSNTVERIMACSDLLISKPGGLSSSEAMAMGLPLIAFAPIPGHEEANAEMMKNAGAALRAETQNELFAIIDQLNNQPELLESMKIKIKELAHPLAAKIILEKI